MRALSPGPRDRGAVLAELILTTLISGMVFTMLPGFYFTYVKIWSREGSRVESMAKAAIVLQRMEKEVRNARSVTVSSDGNSVTATLPRQQYDATVHRLVNQIDESGKLLDGDRVHYYVAPNPGGSGSAFYRRVERFSGASTTPQVIATSIYPQLNPLVSGTSTTQRVFVYDSALRTLTITATAAETRESVGSLSPTGRGPQCSRDRGTLIRVATQSRPQGEIRCQQCGSQVVSNAEIVTHQIQLLLRNT